jgi:hypothetical protein
VNHELTVSVTTWPSHPRRVEYFCRTVDAFADELSRHNLNVKWVISSESEIPADSVFCEDELKRQCEFRGLSVRFRERPASLGSHLNELISSLTTDLWFYLQDDWIVKRKIPLTEACDFLLNNETFGGVRFWANTGHSGVVGRWSVLQKGAAWYYGDNPALWHRRFNQSIGPFCEHGSFGYHEGDASARASGSALELAAPLPVKKHANWYFDHLGEITSVPNDPRWDHAARRRGQA